MTISATLSSALTGLNAAQQALGVIANNVANANTEGYSRKSLGQEALIVGGHGAGVETGDVTRITDRFLTQEMRRQNSVVGQAEVVQRYQSLVQDAFGAPGENRDLASQLGALGAALEGFATSPEAGIFAREVVALADDLQATVGGFADQVQRLRGEADQEISQVIAAINADLQAIDDLNAEITRLSHVDRSNPELFDQRDLLVKSLAEKVEIGTYDREDGALAIYTAGGEALLDTTPRILFYNRPSQITHDATLQPISILREDQIDPSTGTPFNPTAGIELVSGGVRATLSAELQNDAIPDANQLITTDLRGGKLLGLLETRDRILPELDDQIQEFSAGLRFALNAAHNDGVAQPPPAQLSGTRTDLSDFTGATRSGIATLAVIDTTDGSTLLAIEIDLGAAADETALAAQIDTDLGALGSATITAGGQLEITLAGANQGLAIAEGDSSIVFPDAAGRDRDFGLSHYFGLNDLLVGDTRPSEFGVRTDIAADPARLSAAQLDVTTPPLTANLGGAGDNRAAQRLAAALEAEHDFIARGGLPSERATLASYAGDIISHSALLAQHAGEAAERNRAMTDALEARAASVSGVNLDEEMSRLMQFQQAYTVAARVVSIMDELLDDLMSTVS